MSAPLIARIETTRLDIPLTKLIAMSFGDVATQHVVLVRVWDADGAMGIGEASVLGGPHWGSESAESVQAAVERYISPVLIGKRVGSLEASAALMSRALRGNASARHAVETAVADLLGRRRGISVADLLGGRSQDRLPVAWTLSTGSPSGDIEEGERAIAEEGHKRFKLKFGSTTAAADTARAQAIVTAFAGRATVIADVNQGWDEVTAARWLPRLQEIGLEAIEQPLRSGDLAGAARLRVRLGLHVIADEALSDPSAVLRVVSSGAASVLALKPGRDGGLSASRRVAALAQVAGIDLYGGSMLETSVGTAASALLYSAIPDLRFGTELFGPLRLAHDITTRPFEVKGGDLTVPTGPGLGVEIDEHAVSFLSGSRSGIAVPDPAPAERQTNSAPDPSRTPKGREGRTRRLPRSSATQQ